MHGQALLVEANPGMQKHTKAELHGQTLWVEANPGMQKHSEVQGQILLVLTKLLVGTKRLVHTKLLVHKKSKLERESGVQVHVHLIAVVREFQRMVFRGMV